VRVEPTPPLDFFQPLPSAQGTKAGQVQAQVQVQGADLLGNAMCATQTACLDELSAVGFNSAAVPTVTAAAIQGCCQGGPTLLQPLNLGGKLPFLAAYQGCHLLGLAHLQPDTSGP
jgi:hypothetical protein